MRISLHISLGSYRQTVWEKIILLCACAAVAAGAAEPGRRPAAVMADAAPDMRNPEVRRQVVREIARGERERRTAAEERARQLGLPLKGEKPGGGARELAEFDGDRPLYRTTLNANAAISTGASLLRAAPYFASGAGGTVGVWDASSARTTHQEFGGRVTSKDGAAATYDHSSHVAGTICAAGVNSSARGMVPSARVDSYDWNSDLSEMTARGAAYPGEPETLNVSNHSYGYESGWVYTVSPVWSWFGSGTTAAGVEDDYGKYNTYARDVDALAHSLPYYLMFWAAGNDRNNNPSSGQSVALAYGGPTVAYDAVLHPPGDGVYKGGYDTISYSSLAKNVVTVGAVNDAVTGGVRDPSRASMLDFSSWGPADDGRVKPDVVANGNSLFSCAVGGDASYGYMNGTSMASPNAAGTAQQLVSYLGLLFTNRALRASTLKALLIHTADDRGHAGPDYQYGWGLVNGKAAADLLAAYRTNAGTQRVVEDGVATNRTSVSFSFAWDGASPIRATLCWTDPAGASTTAGDSRTPRLVNNLDLRIMGPSGTEHRPWVMPFVGDWSVASCGYAATTGSNVTDNVEQVLIAAPPAAGTYTARVTFAGTLTGGRQPFSLILSGVSATRKVPAPAVTASSPSNGTGVLPFVMKGDRFLFGAEACLRKAGLADVAGANVEVQGDTAKARFDATGMASGWWRLVLTNPDGQRSVLWNAFAVPGPLWTEAFETADLASGWTVSSEVGSSQWAQTTAKSFSPTRSMYSPGVASRSDTSLVSPTLAIPSEAQALQVSFWHDFSFESDDGGVLEFSLDGGAWYDVAASGSGASFASGGYTASIGGTGPPNERNPLTGRTVWSGSSGGFQQVAVSLSDTAKYAGHGLRLRWRLGTNSSTASAGWYVDSVVLFGIGNPPPAPRAGSVVELR
jgi:hypothetical protein